MADQLPDFFSNVEGIGDRIRHRWGSVQDLNAAAASGDSEARAWVDQPATMAKAYKPQSSEDAGTALAQPSTEPPTGSIKHAIRDHAQDYEHLLPVPTNENALAPTMESGQFASVKHMAGFIDQAGEPVNEPLPVDPEMIRRLQQTFGFADASKWSIDLALKGLRLLENDGRVPLGTVADIERHLHPFGRTYTQTK